MSTGDHKGGPDASSQVRIWNAPTQAGGGVGTGTAYPAGQLAVDVGQLQIVMLDPVADLLLVRQQRLPRRAMTRRPGRTQRRWAPTRTCSPN